MSLHENAPLDLVQVDTDDARRIKRKLYCSRLNQFSLEKKSGKVRRAGGFEGPGSLEGPGRLRGQ